MADQLGAGAGEAGRQKRSGLSPPGFNRGRPKPDLKEGVSRVDEVYFVKYV